MANILLKLTGNADDAKAVLDDTIGDIQAFGKERATAELRVDAEQAKRDIAEVVAEMAAVPKEETIRIRVAGEQAKLQQLLARKSGLENQLTSAAAAGEPTDALVQRLGSYSQRIEAVRGRIESLSQDFEHLGQSGEREVSKLTRATGALAGGLTRARTGAVSFVSNLVGKVPLIGGLFSKVAEGVGQLATNLLPEAAQGAMGLVGSLMGLVTVGPILVVIVVAMSALVVSIGEALIGIVALGVAFLAALVPIIAVLGVVLIKIKDIVSGQVALKQANANLKTAIDAQKSAVTQLHQAEVTQHTTRLQAIQAERQALLQLQDAENQTADARLGVQSARLQLAQARLTLRQFRQELAGMGTKPGDLLGAAQGVSVSGNFGQTQQGSSPLAWLQMLLQYKQDILSVKEAAQGTKDSVQGLKDATNSQLTAQENWAQYLKRGLKAYQPYMQALNAVRLAQENLKRADDQLKAAELAKTQAIRHGASDASAFMKMWDKLKHTLGVVFGPAEEAVFKGIEQALGILAGKLKPLMPAFLQLGKAIGGAFVWWAKMMVKPDNMKLLVVLIKQAAHFTTTMSHYLGSGLKFLVKIAESAMPSLIGIFTHWGKQLGSANTHTKSIQNFIHMAIGKATTFWHMLLHVGNAITRLSKFLQGLGVILSPILAALGKIVELYQTIQDIRASEGKANTAGSVAAGATGGLIEKDEKLLKGGNISNEFRRFLQTQIKGLQSQVGSITDNSFAVKGIVGLPTTQNLVKANPSAAAGARAIHIEHQHVAENANTVGNHDHFARKLRKNMTRLGGGLK